jgi:hypothetical protein
VDAEVGGAAEKVVDHLVVDLVGQRKEDEEGKVREREDSKERQRERE